MAYFLRPSDDSEFRDIDGETTSAVDWSIKKNKTYENARGIQDEAILVSGIKQSMATAAS